MLNFKLITNTDNVDIDAKCVGVSAWVSGDSVSALNSNRGLHIQIRHNRDKATYLAANELAQLIAAAPEMRKGLAGLVEAIQNYNPNATVGQLREALASHLELVVVPALGMASNRK